uniref:Uncharacterized protein n=1 Tax=Clytia hemisphaerica TaxID=252671 RepID=A0A7M5WQ29_9CNID|eukprot:TCONS_00061841-protein
MAASNVGPFDGSWRVNEDDDWYVSQFGGAREFGRVGELTLGMSPNYLFHPGDRRCINRLVDRFKFVNANHPCIIAVSNNKAFFNLTWDKISPEMFGSKGRGGGKRIRLLQTYAFGKAAQHLRIPFRADMDVLRYL